LSSSPINFRIKEDSRKTQGRLKENSRKQGRLKAQGRLEEARKTQGRLKEDSRKTQKTPRKTRGRLEEQGRLKEDSRKTLGKEDSRKTQGRLVVVVWLSLFVIMEGSDLFKQALEGGSSLILLSSPFRQREPLLNHCILFANY
jgi:hypothetical protein